ncbi:MAG: HlyD family efflux transporter periplasmic adaptor subunit, partial [Bacteroidota bacterium]
TPKNIEDAVFASGYTEQENIYTVSAKVDGILISLPIKEGDAVKKNDWIAIIENDIQNNQLEDALVVYKDAQKNADPNSPQLQNLQGQIDQAKQQVAFDKENYLRYKDLWAKQSIAQIDFEKVELQYKVAQSNLQSLQKQYKEVQNTLALNVERSRVQVNTQRSLLKDYKLSTEVSGKVIDVFKKQGELVRKGEPIAKVASGDYLIKLFISEDDIAHVNIGHQAAISMNTYPNQVFKASVSKIYPAFDEEEQSYIIEAQFDEWPEKMFSGTQLQANIETGSRKDVLVIPTAYVSRGSYVHLPNGEERQIKIGSKNEEWTEVISGISQLEGIVKPKN